jgi:hypothetical protein
MTILKRSLLTLGAAMLCAAASAAQAQTAPPPAPTTDSGVMRRIPLDEWVPQSCPNPEQQGEIIVCGRPDEEPSVPPEQALPGDRGTDVQSERAALLAPGNAAPSQSCTNVGAGGQTGCINAEYQQWKRERELQKAREKAEEPE